MQSRNIEKRPRSPTDFGTLRSAKFIGSQAEYLFISGAVGLDPKTKTVPDNLNSQISHMFNNLTTIIKLAGTSAENTLRIILYLTNMNYLNTVEKAYNEWFTGKKPPSRTIVVVKDLPRGAKVEIDLVGIIQPDLTAKTIPSGILPKSLATIIHAKRVTKDASFVFLSGNIGIDPQSGQLISSNFIQQVRQTMLNIENTLVRSNSSLQSIIKTHIYLSDISYFDAFVDEYAKWFTEEEYPSRTTIAVNKLPLNSLVQIDVIAIEDAYQSSKGIIAEDIPDAIRPFSLAKKVRNPFDFSNGLIGDEKDGKLPQTMVDQLKNIMKKMLEILTARKNKLNEVLKATIYVTSIKEFSEVREEYERWFLKGQEPTGLYLEVVEFPKKAKILIDFVYSEPEVATPKL